MTMVQRPMDKWKDIPWKKIEREVFKLQKRIYQASQEGRVQAVHKLQRLLMASRGAKLLATRRVTQDNAGKKTAGVDGVKALNPNQRMKLSKTLRIGGKASPLRRVWIPKPGTKEKRPLGIPTLQNRAVQALGKLAMEPEWEAKFEGNSYGFRIGRSCHDAIAAIFTSISRDPKAVLDADITKCFDRINHEELLKKLGTYPALRRQIKAWLRAGILDGETLFPTVEGTPQGGVISPLLANIALHGLETEIIEHFRRKGYKRLPTIIRYADDFVILHKDRKVIKECLEVASQWLLKMGLELKPSKTRLAHTLEAEDGKVGFDFLGFHIRHHRVGKTRRCLDRMGRPVGTRAIIKPSKAAIKRHTQKLREIIDGHRVAEQEQLIYRLNQIIVGWANYYSTVVSKKVFSKLGHILVEMLLAWGRRRHPNHNRHWIAAKYFRVEEGEGWTFGPRNSPCRLRKHSETPIRRHVKVQGTRSVYDGDWLYWSTRRGQDPLVSEGVARLLKKQKGCCSGCGLHFKDGDILERDHIQPRRHGGTNQDRNRQLLHRHCHHQKSAQDRKRGAHERSHAVEEPCDGKLSSTVLKPSPRGDRWA